MTSDGFYTFELKMKSKITLFTILMTIVLRLSAQSITPLSSNDMVYYESVAAKLTSIIDQRITALGVPADSINPILIVYPKIGISRQNRTSYPPIRYSVDFDVQLYFANIYDCRQFAKCTFSLTGKGGSLEEALLTSVSTLESNTAVDNFIHEGLNSAKSYYDNASSTIINSASRSLTQGQWKDAFLKLNSIPECSSYYVDAQKELNSALEAYAQETESYDIQREVYNMMCQQSYLLKQLAPRFER